MTTTTAPPSAPGAHAATREPVLRVEDVQLRFGQVTAIDGVSFDVLPDELFAVIGPNGAGKTSIFNVISGVYRPQQGSVTLDGKRLDGARPAAIARRGVARTFQNIELFANLTVIDNLMLGRHQHIHYGTLSALAWIGRARRQELVHRRAVEEIVDFLDLAAWRAMPVGLLPYGVQKRVELGRALAMEPRLLLLDEPVAGMNLEETEDMARYISDIRGELGVSMIMVEHDMALVMDLADRVMVLDFGVPVTTGTPAQVQRDPRVVAAYLGGELDAAGDPTDATAAGAEQVRP
ncbi:MAG: ABC transporter ATP-binding protein [Aeromicrobium sp.]|uniref:ABC transporter ATP-binding protein n=1 Tax=Aeromicrobium sp. TaxID=1871063 RepID=UPI0025BCB4BF|nr:ABC transporter ATP-binding protein [Aeromicrobium sp.]MCK5890141.1 ABC transporter ATP-binding protein [Aeromicrobium sp.]MDF1703814.1 ABC transporter ATP-binding protein [Aeromicrobium sp.]